MSVASHASDSIATKHATQVTAVVYLLIHLGTSAEYLSKV